MSLALIVFLDYPAAFFRRAGAAWALVQTACYIRAAAASHTGCTCDTILMRLFWVPAAAILQALLSRWTAIDPMGCPRPHRDSRRCASVHRAPGLRVVAGALKNFIALNSFADQSHEHACHRLWMVSFHLRLSAHRRHPRRSHDYAALLGNARSARAASALGHMNAVSTRRSGECYKPVLATGIFEFGRSCTPLPALSRALGQN